MLNETNMMCTREQGHNLPKYIAFIVSVLLSLIVIPSLYGIIWFEKFGTDSKRTLINQLVSSICWYLIITILCLQFPMTARIILKEAFNRHVCALIDFTASGLYNMFLGKLKLDYK